MAFGAKKYGVYNWLDGMEWSRLVGAVMRHVLAWHGGEDLDPETGASHLAHARCCLAMLMGYQELSIGEDDRYGTVNHQKLLARAPAQPQPDPSTPLDAPPQT